MTLFLYYLPAAIAAGLVLGLAGSQDFKRGLMRGGLNVALLVGGMIALGLLVTLAENPAF